MPLASVPGVAPPAIFDRAARRLRRDRIAAAYRDHDFVRAAMVDGIADRLAMVRREFTAMLDVGCFDASIEPPSGARVARCDAGYAFARAAAGVQADEDRLPFADGSFDLIVSAGVLDQVDDLPGSLSLIRRMLRPDGLFLGAFLGAGSLPVLRAALLAAEAERPAARLHPGVEVRAAGDLMQRAGFAMPVADVETLDVGYAGIGRLLDDLRGMGAGNMMLGRRPVARAALARAAAAFAGAGTDGRTRERFSMVFVTGWAPDPSQPRAARRGSATTSLAEALRTR